MALLIDIKQPEWMTDEHLRETLLKVYPAGDIRCGAAPGNLDEIEMLVASTYLEGEALRYPNLKLIQKPGAGVETIIADQSIPKSVKVARIRSDTPAHQIAEYCLAGVLQEQRHLRQYRDSQALSHWQGIEPRQPGETTVAVLGLGQIGSVTASRFLANQFKVIGWSRSQKELAGVDCYSGMEQLTDVLALADYVLSILPSTSDTRGLFHEKIFRCMKPGSVLINAGRGDLVNEVDLVAALDDGKLAHAILDVMQNEPLPAQSPMWLHPNITLTPHISGWHLGDSINDIAENFRRLENNESLLHLVDRQFGY
ncbi:MAG: glyoxylate/hydroxypyruvate reductase A [Gammaproteobacteria bacterium]|jgi:glyoxylate/hydroxypyruvate reductase A